MIDRRPIRESGSRRIVVLAAAVALTVLALVSGCGGGSTTPSDENPTPSTGAVDVTVSGLPGGTAGDVTLTGDSGFTRLITASTLVGGVPAGPCTITARPVVSAPSDTLFALVPVTTRSVVANDTISVTVTYEPQALDALITVFHGPVVFQGARYDDSFVPIEDYGQLPTLESDIDTYEFPYDAGYVVDGCEIVGTDVTEDGIDVATAISGRFGNGSATGTLTVDSETSVTITAGASGTASGSSAYVGNGASSGVMNMGYPGPRALYDLCILISNPDGTPFDLVFTWEYSGSVVNTVHANWHHRFVYQIDPPVCAQAAAPTELYWGRDFEGPSGDSGTVTIPLTGTSHLVAFGMWASASGFWVTDNLGNTDSGSASCSGSVTIEVVR